jgi:D-sedoheptulose 7-phosphate isomerase
MPLSDYLAESAEVLHRAASAIGQDAVDRVTDAIVSALSSGKPLLVCGNGGSAADAIHITGELVGRFLEDRRALKVICLATNPGAITAWSNDHSFDTAYARQVEAYGEKGAVLLGISTSGTSRNIVAAFEKARQMEMVTIALTGEGGGKLAALADFLLSAPTRHTPLVQQVHVCLYHYLCEQIERRMMSL